MVRRLLILVLGLVALLPVAATGQTPDGDADHNRFTGSFTAADWGGYRYLPFPVPDGVTSIRVRYSYAAGRLPAIVDIGIFDPEKFRGWSGSEKREFTVAQTRELTTDAYLPGPIPAGEWRVILGFPNLGPAAASIYRLLGASVNYTVEIDLGREPVGPAFVTPPRRDVALKTGPAWYRGELHSHSTHSDGSYPLADVYAHAHGVGLDFIAVTDHNALSQFASIADFQYRHPDLLILHGLELTTSRGHANVFNYDRFVDFRASVPGYDLNRIIDEIHDGSGYFSINHPGSVLGGGIPWLIPTDWSKVDFFEVFNGPTRQGLIPAPSNQDALRDWDRLLQKGYRITAIGGSDDHHTGKGGGSPPATIGSPLNMVYARELSPSAIFGAVKAGHVYLLNDGPESGIRVEFTATGGGATAMMGDLIAADEIAFVVKVEGARGKTLVIVENGRRRSRRITADRFEHGFSLKPAAAGYVRLEVTAGAFPEAVTNPIYFRAKPEAGPLGR